MKPFEVNIRTVSAFRSCGVGYTGLEKFCCMMNMPAPMTVMNYNISNRLRDAAKIVTENSMKDAVVEAKKIQMWWLILEYRLMERRNFY